MAVRTKGTISFGEQDIDLSAVEQLAEHSQTRAIAAALQWIGAQVLHVCWHAIAFSVLTCTQCV